MGTRRPGLAFPHPHFMAFAPLDVWWRMLNAPRARVPAKYMLRLAFALFTSALATVLTLPERLVLGVWRPWRRAQAPEVVAILGYYRTGTTHLHYLMSCDPGLRTPAWCETLAPQGYALSWAFLRVFMIPFVSARRPQDDVAIGPGWPAEDDFALNNGALASSLPGRFVVPDLHEHYARFHDLAGLSPAEMSRWRDGQRALVWKIATLARGRRVLLKTPSHTARVDELTALFAGRVKFVHISRDPAAVIRSNVNMATRLSVYNLQDPPADDEVRRRVVEEYLRTERLYVEQARRLGPGRYAELRYEDLIADPLGQLRRIYTELGMAWSAEFEGRARAYLESVKGYRAADQRDAAAQQAREVRDEHGSHPTIESSALAELVRRFGHDRPPVPRAPDVSAASPARDAGTPVPGGATARGARRRTAAAAAGVVVAAGVLLAWLAQAYVMHNRHDWLIWPVGVAIGWSVIRVARAGAVWLGAWAALLTAATYLAAAGPGTFLADYAHRPTYAGWWRGEVPWPRWEWDHIARSTRAGVTSTANIFWAFMGVVTAYRFASRRYVNPPGRG